MTIKTSTPAEIMDAELEHVTGGDGDLLFGDRGWDLAGGTQDDDFTLNGGTLSGARSTSGHYTQVVWAKR
ncbi:MAG: hypothetical protein AAF674_04210 [Pseudomonadota bacterium]